MIRRMLVADDGSPSGERAFVAALDLARRLSVGLDMICVEELPRFPATHRRSRGDARRSRRRLRQGGRGGESEGGGGRRAVRRPYRRRASRFEHRRIRRSGGYDLLVVGFMGHSALYNRIIGSAPDRLVDLAPCTVMVVK